MVDNDDPEAYNKYKDNTHIKTILMLSYALKTIKQIIMIMNIRRLSSISVIKPQLKSPNAITRNGAAANTHNAGRCVGPNASEASRRQRAACNNSAPLANTRTAKVTNWATTFRSLIRSRLSLCGNLAWPKIFGPTQKSTPSVLTWNGAWKTRNSSSVTGTIRTKPCTLRHVLHRNGKPISNTAQTRKTNHNTLNCPEAI